MERVKGRDWYTGVSRQDAQQVLGRELTEKEASELAMPDGQPDAARLMRSRLFGWGFCHPWALARVFSIPRRERHHRHSGEVA